jgi:ABC-type phosphate/phosphonate transport system ATPase subunit
MVDLVNVSCNWRTLSLPDISYKINAGERIALVGATEQEKHPIKINIGEIILKTEIFSCKKH